MYSGSRVSKRGKLAYRASRRPRFHRGGGIASVRPHPFLPENLPVLQLLQGDERPEQNAAVSGRGPEGTRRLAATGQTGKATPAPMHDFLRRRDAERAVHAATGIPPGRFTRPVGPDRVGRMDAGDESGDGFAGKGEAAAFARGQSGEHGRAVLGAAASGGAGGGSTAPSRPGGPTKSCARRGSRTSTWT